MVGGVDVDGRNVVGQEHDLVGVQFTAVLTDQILRSDETGLQQPRTMKVPVPVNGSRIWTSASDRVVPKSACSFYYVYGTTADAPEEAITSRRSWLVSRGDVFDVRPSNQDQRTDPPMEAPNIGLNLAELARHINPVVRGSMQYYGAFYRSRAVPTPVPLLSVTVAACETP